MNKLDLITAVEATALDEVRAKRKRLFAKHPAFFAEVGAILFAEDPININYETNIDEYYSEVGTIIPRLKECNVADDVIRVICEEMVSWFGVTAEHSIAQFPDMYHRIGVRVWTAWQQHLQGK